MTYQNGTTSRISVSFTDINGNAVDPSAITLVVQPPRGATSTTYTYAGSTVTKDSVGNYHVDVLLNSSGIWWYRWTGQATDNVTAEQSLQVLAQQVGGSH